MRYLIDGYNLMYAGGLLGPRLGSDRFRKVRTRFLNDLADALGAVEAHQTTVVFDASNAPEAFAREVIHKGISVVYAVGDESADARIERILSRHGNPRSLTVVSSDRRVRQAAGRRKASSVSADDFWATLDALKSRRRPRAAEPAPDPPRDPPRDRPPGAAEAAHWLREFGDIDQQPETREALNAGGVPMLTDDEIAAIEREIERETGGP